MFHGRGMSGATGSVSLHRPDLTPLRQDQRPHADLRRCPRSLLDSRRRGRRRRLPVKRRVRHRHRVRSHRPAVRSGTRRGGPAHHFWSQPRCGGHPSARRRNSLATSPASNLTANASEGEFRSPGQIRETRQPPRRRCVSARMARAAHPSTRRFRPAMTLPDAFALTGGVS